ncbi:metalloregulator ArsR/SmtB family transcription factor [Clostridium sp. CM028]|uniref:ArsR/SmtB family transcription factor n=1 Tax=Clostridium TaxID=1485 RepID=UPI0013EE59D1|nr:MULTISPECIES: metalloregulator ArsR/SmtB family transcription factor [Clostridium]MBU3090588.1 metalloregulator ArsR/SmtB family transcription factor [Clostridium sp. CF011]MBW9144413.1 metalloregulator ArsR/SmtB family transcription factor [Clostridium sp. CM027]MBW9149351.1 metalloregulator ArsR/SmtB family transcription factor [Clostridium sp. CM028]MBZ9608698.1 metalloregulator ArsR/SmtB family transcription factor [Clostridium estertheticum]UVE40960.1 metalloregulator ArsR/SmtB family 
MNANFEQYTEIADLLKAIAHPARICIIRGLMNKGRCNVSYMQNCLNLPQSTVSQHLQKLKSFGIIKGERNGLQINYKICNETIINVINAIFPDEH